MRMHAVAQIGKLYYTSRPTGNWKYLLTASQESINHCQFGSNRTLCKKRGDHVYIIFLSFNFIYEKVAF